MSDIKKVEKGPVDNAANKIRESATKEIQNKINEKVKAALDAKKAFNILKQEIRDLIREQEVDKSELSSFIDELK